MNMIVLIKEIANYIIPEDNTIRKGLGEIMGGKILKLRSEELLEQGEAKGKLEGKREERLEAIQNIRKGIIFHAHKGLSNIFIFLNLGVK